MDRRPSLPTVRRKRILGVTTFRAVPLFSFVHFTFDPTTLRAPGALRLPFVAVIIFDCRFDATVMYSSDL